jgi:L-aminopeptidase/D-esterase-like protein
MPPPRPRPGPTDSIVDVPGVRVGQVELPGARSGAAAGGPVTGLSVVVVPGGALGAVDVRGGAPGTRETDALDPTAAGERVHAVCIVGRSVFGLAAADGVTTELERRGIGLGIDLGPVGRVTIPIVAAAVVFDFATGEPLVRPGPADGALAVARALDHPPARPAAGRSGAGAGAGFGTLAGRRHIGGVGHASLVADLPGGTLVVGALAVLNAAGRVVAGPRRGPDRLPAVGAIEASRRNTVPAVVATNAVLTKAELTRVAIMAHDGIARVVRPSHTAFDGDTVFALAVPDGPETPAVEVGPWTAARTTIVGALAAEAVEGALREAAGGG